MPDLRDILQYGSRISAVCSVQIKSSTFTVHRQIHSGPNLVLGPGSVVDPNPDWIRIQIRNPDPDPGERK